MIIDHIENYQRYEFLGEPFIRALRFLKDYDIKEIVNENVVIDPEFGIFAKIRPMTAKTMDAAVWEGHRYHADIHYLTEGVEKFGFNYIKKLQEINYNEGNDNLSLQGSGQFVLLEKGYFIITFPEDAHLPALAVDETNPQKIGKIIVKIKV